MADPNDRNPLNIPGIFYNDTSCIDCGMCPDIAPNIFTRNDEEGLSNVHHQPTTSEDIALAEEAVDSCPTESIGIIQLKDED